jgi:hypothetical protein
MDVSGKKGHSLVYMAIVIVHCSLRGDGTFGESGVHVFLGGVKLLLLGLEYHSEFLFSLFLFLSLAVYIRTVIRVLRCCKDWVSISQYQYIFFIKKAIAFV